MQIYPMDINIAIFVRERYLFTNFNKLLVEMIIHSTFFFPLVVINEVFLKSRETTNVCKGYAVSNFKLWLFTKVFAITC